MLGNFFEYVGGQLVPLTLAGEYLGKDADGEDIIVPIQVDDPGTPIDPTQFLPLAPSITVTMPTRTTATVTITAPTNPAPRTPITSYQVWRRLNSEEAAALVGTVSASGPLTFADTGLPTNTTPEHTFSYAVFAVNEAGVGASSNTVVVQWQGTTLSQPTAPTNLVRSNLTSTSVTLSWQETTDSTITKHGIFEGNVLVRDNIPANARTYTWSGMTAGSTHTNVNVRRYNGATAGNPAGWSPASNMLTFTNPQTTTGSLFLGHVPGRIYLGWSTNLGEKFTSNTDQPGQNTMTPDQLATSQLDTYTPGAGSYSDLIGVRRLYDKNTPIINYADAANRVVWISAKPGKDFGLSDGVPGWSQVANGSGDAAIRNYFQSLVNRNRLTVFSFNHEPIGDVTNATDATIFVNANRRIRQVVDTAYPGHRIVFCFNYEENRLRNLRVNGQYVRWDLWLPEDWQEIWDFPSFDFYQYGANRGTNGRNGVEMSQRWWRVDELFSGDFVPQGTQPMPWMRLRAGVDFVYGIGETSARPGAFYNYERGSGDQPSNMTGARWARDQWNYIFANIDKFWMVSTFNSLGANGIYNDERLVPLAITGSTATHNHPSFVQQTGDTERTIDIYREKLRSGLTIKLGSNGLPAV